MLFIFALFNIQANSYAQNKKLTLSMENTTIEEILNKIESESKFKFFYISSEVDVARITSIDVKNTPIKKVLNQIFSNEPVDYSVVKKQIILKPSVQENIAATSETFEPDEKPKIQGLLVKGIITDKNGIPIGGVNVLEKNSTNGVASDFDGSFAITVEGSESILVFSYLGFKTKEIVVSNQEIINLIIEEDSQGLNEVVVIGYGTQRKGNVSGAISTVGTEAIEGRPVADFQSALQGQVAGLQITKNSGTPGGGGNIRIRGTGSITGGSSPLYVIDGNIISTGVGGGGGEPLRHPEPYRHRVGKCPERCLGRRNIWGSGRKWRNHHNYEKRCRRKGPIQFQHLLRLSTGDQHPRFAGCQRISRCLQHLEGQ